MIQANLNHISKDTLEQLSVLAKQNGMSVEEYHADLLDFWVAFPINLKNFTAKKTKSLPIQLTEKQQKIPNIEQAIANRSNFAKDLLAMPIIEGHDDLFECRHEGRQIDVDDLVFDDKNKR